mmetsp:Transcript_25939/g.36491  ORF Transcript_25939/g.36491 Transcript_25939/m.36491 type:complete len:1100 (-) Transcript_25939:85-3384(-)
MSDETKQTAKSRKLYEWLKTIELADFYQNFIDAGYDSLAFLKENGLDNEDFDLLKIDKQGHRKRLTMGLKKLDPKWIQDSDNTPTKTEAPSQKPSSNSNNNGISQENTSYTNIDQERRLEQNTYPANDYDAKNELETFSYDPNAPREKVVFVRTLASGEFGVTDVVLWRGKEVVGKHIKNMNNAADLMKEASLMGKIPAHPNVVQFLGIAEDDKGTWYILMEFVPLGDLERILLNTPQMLTEDVILELLLGVSCGMMHLHSCGILHRDLAPRNILVDNKFQPKITDFGMAREASTLALSNLSQIQVYQSMKTLYGEDARMPIFILAPESLAGNYYTKMTDVWAFGVLCFQLITRKLPYPTVNDLILLRDGQKDFPVAKLQKRGVHHQIIDLLLRCHARNPDERPSFTEIYSVLTQYKYSKILEEKSRQIMDAQASKYHGIVNEKIKELQEAQMQIAQLTNQCTKLEKELQTATQELATKDKKLKEAQSKVTTLESRPHNAMDTSVSLLESAWYIPMFELSEANFSHVISKQHSSHASHAPENQNPSAEDEKYLHKLKRKTMFLGSSKKKEDDPVADKKKDEKAQSLRVAPSRARGGSLTEEAALASEGTKVGEVVQKLMLKRWVKDVTVVLKGLKYPEVVSSLQNGYDVYRDVESLSRLRHPSVAPIYGFCNSSTVHLAREYVKGMNLTEYMHQYAEHITMEHKNHILISIASALIFMHKQNVIHGNLKPNNVLVETPQFPSELPNVRISDPLPLLDHMVARFRNHLQYRFSDNESVEEKFSSVYGAPEIFTPSKPINELMDVYSFGIIMWELVENKQCSTRPLPAVSSSNTLFQSIIKRCADSDATQRPAVSTVRAELQQIERLMRSPSPNQSLELQPKIDLSTMKLEDQIMTIFQKADHKTLLWSVFDKSIVQGVLRGTYRHSEKIKPVLVEITPDKKEELVKLEKWSSFVRWFSPLGIPKEQYANTDKDSSSQFDYTLDQICSIAGESWFFGFMSAEEARDFLRMSTHPVGTFLFRFSSTEKKYALSVKGETVIGHWRINTSEANRTLKFFIDDKEYSSFFELIRRHATQSLEDKGGGATYFLKCPANRLQWRGLL